MNHELVLLSKQIDWEAVESEFAEYYCADNGRPSVPIRTMVGIMLLKNITFPTDAKLYRKIIEQVLKVSEREHIELLRTYTREVKALKLKVRFMNHPTRVKEGKKAVKRLRTIAKAMVNDIARKMSDIQLSSYREDIELYLRVIKQERSDKDKVYSLHEPEVECISKGKEHKKYEFGNKRAGIEPVIGHLKYDHRMMRNYLKGTLGDAINTMMAAAAYNMRHWMNKHALSSFVS